MIGWVWVTVPALAIRLTVWPPAAMPVPLTPTENPVAFVRLTDPTLLEAAKLPMLFAEVPRLMEPLELLLADSEPAVTTADCVKPPVVESVNVPPTLPANTRPPAESVMLALLAVADTCRVFKALFPVKEIAVAAA